MKRIVSLILTSVLLLGLICSCSSDTDNGGGSGKDVIKTDDDYQIPEINLNGEDFTVLNVDNFAYMKIAFTAEADSDDTLDVAIYESNKRIEEQFNLTFVEDKYPFVDWGTSHIEMAQHFVKNLNAGDDIYEFLHFPMYQSPDLITNGYVTDLTDLESLNLDKPWWDTMLNEQITINDRLYMACGSINFMPFEGMTTIFFNKDMLVDYHLDDPYEMVRNGTWTIDAMVELAREVISMGTDANWHVYDGGTSTYGVSRTGGFGIHFLIGSGQNYTVKENDEYVFNTGNDDFFLAIDKMMPIFDDVANGGVGIGHANEEPGFYIDLFGQGRALFLVGELKAGVEMRDYDVNFGILPAPKLRAEQETYYSSGVERLPFICIPELSEDAERTAAILDAMAYDRYKNVVPVYYDSYISYKGLRDEESLEMLEIMTAGRTIDIGFAYGWCNSIVKDIITNGIPQGYDVASGLKTYEKSINRKIETFIGEYMS